MTMFYFLKIPPSHDLWELAVLPLRTDCTVIPTTKQDNIRKDGNKKFDFCTDMVFTWKYRTFDFNEAEFYLNKAL